MTGDVLTGLYSASARLFRKLRRPKRFNRSQATTRLQGKVLAWWDAGIDDLYDYLNEIDGWYKLARHVRVQQPIEKAVRKTITDEDASLIAELLAKYSYYDDIQAVAAAIIKATAEPTFEEAAMHALKQLGVANPEFRLVNNQIRENILDRKAAAVHATRNNVESIMQTILDNFYELGRNPFDANFLAALRRELGNVTLHQAKRFALTETAIVAETAQYETFIRNGVTGKRWKVLGRNTRDSHAMLDGVEVHIDKPFVLLSSDGNSYEARHPSDPGLPPQELIHCHCWMEPVVSDDFEIDPSRVWGGE